MLKNILVTRPLRQSIETSNAIFRDDFFIFNEPLFEINKIPISKYIDKTLPIIVTSINATEDLNIEEFDKRIPIYAVGEKLANKICNKGFINVKYPKISSAIDLKNLIIQDSKDKNFNYLHGSNITLDFEFELKEFGFKIRKIMTYKTTPNNDFSGDFHNFIKNNKFDFVLLFSKKTAEIFFSLAKDNNLLEYFKASEILCLSNEILNKVQEFNFFNSATFSQNLIFSKLL